jgi:hypothetical protein
MKGFCEKKFSSMLISGTFTKAVMYLMLLSDSIIAGHFIGVSGVAGIWLSVSGREPILMRYAD